MNTWAFVLVVAATIVLVNVAAFARRSERGFRTYFADPNHHRSIPIFLSTVGTIVGGGMFLAVGQIGYEAGITGIVIGVSYLVGLSLLAVFAPALRKALAQHDCVTLIDLLETSYSKRVATLFSAVSACMYFFLLAGQFVALYEFAHYAESLTSAVWVPWALVALGGTSMLLYPVIGGLRKDISTDVFQVVLVIGATVGLMWLFLDDPHASGMWTTLPAEHLSGVGNSERGYGPLFLVGVLVFVPGLFLVRNDMWQRIGAAKSARHLRLVFVSAGACSCLFYIAFTLIGMWALDSGIPSPKTATLDMIVRSSPGPWVLGLMIGALFAAVLSSADTFVNNASGFLTRIARPFDWARMRDDANNRKLLVWSRCFAFLIVLVGATLAWVSRDIVDLLVAAFSLLLIFLPTVLGTFLPAWRRESAAYYGSWAGLLLFGVLFFAWSPKLAFAPAVLVAILVYGAIVRFHKPRDSDHRPDSD